MKHLCISIHSKPVGGQTRIKGFSIKDLRWKGTLFALGGILADAAACVSLLLAAIFLQASPIASGVCIILLIEQLWLSGWNIFPHDTKQNGTTTPNDGKQFVHFITGKYTKGFQKTIRVFENMIARHDQNIEQIEPWLLNASHETMMQFFQATEDFKEKRYDKAIKTYQRLIDAHLLSRGVVACVLDNLACLPIIFGERQYLHDAFTWAEEAYKLLPQSKTIQGTYGSLLAEHGQLDAAIRFLTPLTEEGNDDIDRSISSCHLAKIHAQQGKSDQAWFWLNKGRSLDESCGVCERIEQELTSGLEVDFKPAAPNSANASA